MLQAHMCPIEQKCEIIKDQDTKAKDESLVDMKVMQHDDDKDNNDYLYLCYCNLI